ncbi:MAG: acyl-CoA dehydrogenase family protein [Chloroflexi bacterium]|nr:acyl-CoA dehydrogenase family protein [Chloroflexota bacterium]
MQASNEAAAKDARSILENIRELAADFAGERSERQQRRELVQADFDRLRDTGFLRTAVPVEQGGIWEGLQRSNRAICEMLRALAQSDSSVALVASMHPSVLQYTGWLSLPEAPHPYRGAWDEQRRWAFQTALDGSQWGTIMSEAGSGGDTSKTKATARPTGHDDTYLLDGEKHFGSGSGITSYVITIAVPEGEDEADIFFMDMRDVPWDGSTGMKLAAAWDGCGMTATQSHSMTFKDFPVTRSAWPGASQLRSNPGGGYACMFAAVVVGIVESAIGTARRQLQRKRDSMLAYERTEWARVEIEGWLIQQAYEGMLRAVEQPSSGNREPRLGKAAIAELAESVMLRICKVVGGGSYSRNSPFGFWLEDVRALGFLRPPWGLAFDQIYQGSWDA